jgi:uncharacterized protein YjbI with pentapeptide repeats
VRYTVLSHKAITAWAMLIVLVGVGVAVWLLLAFSGGDTETNRVQLDAIRTAGTIVVGTGGAAALLLAARRQRSTEIALRQTDREQVTDLYAKAVEQLGSEKAPVRLGGLYALERLAQDNPGQRQTIINVWCAYLRMPYTPPAPDAPDPGAEEAVVRYYHERVQEREVRLTAQRLLTDHLRPGADPDHPAATFWADMVLDLTGATLIEFDLGGCQAWSAVFTRAHFIGETSFDHAHFTSHAWFSRARFTDVTSFVAARFTGDAWFDRVQVTGNAQFFDVQFTHLALFDEARFTGHAWFGRAKFTDRASFIEVQFTGHATFQRVQFTGPAWFGGVQFTGDALFDEAQFTGDAAFHKVQFTGKALFDEVHFTGPTSFAEAQFTGDVPKEVAPFWSPPVEASKEEHQLDEGTES